jgi:hypothetical protein
VAGVVAICCLLMLVFEVCFFLFAITFRDGLLN